MSLALAWVSVQVARCVVGGESAASPAPGEPRVLLAGVGIGLAAWRTACGAVSALSTSSSTVCVILSRSRLLGAECPQDKDDELYDVAYLGYGKARESTREEARYGGGMTAEALERCAPSSPRLSRG